MSSDITWGDIFESIGLGSHEKINMKLEVLQTNIGKRCRVIDTCHKTVIGKEGFIIDVAGCNNRFRYTVELDELITTVKHATPFRKIYLPTTHVEIIN